jgi:hypothetical protein
MLRLVDKWRIVEFCSGNASFIDRLGPGFIAFE